MADFKEIKTQEELDAIIQGRVARAEETAKKKYEGYISPDDFKSKTDGLNQQIAALNKSLEDEKAKVKDFEKKDGESQAKIKQYETDSLKTKIAAELGLPYELTGRLVGDTEETIKADAQKLLGIVRKNNVPPLGNTEGHEANPEKEALKGFLNNLKGN